MAKGLQYYQADTDRFHDIRIRKLLRRWGCNGYCVYEFILNECYRTTGYYIEWDDDVAFMCAEALYIDESIIIDIVGYACSVGLFNASMYEQHGVLTSESIQRRFLDINKRAKRACSITDFAILSKTSEEKGKTPEESENFRKNGDDIPDKSANASILPQNMPENASDDADTAPQTAIREEETLKQTSEKMGRTSEETEFFRKNGAEIPNVSEEMGKTSENAAQNKVKKRKEKEKKTTAATIACAHTCEAEPVDAQIDRWNSQLDHRWVEAASQEFRMPRDRLAELKEAFAAEKKTDCRQEGYPTLHSYVQHLKNWLRVKIQVEQKQTNHAKTTANNSANSTTQQLVDRYSATYSALVGGHSVG